LDLDVRRPRSVLRVKEAEAIRRDGAGAQYLTAGTGKETGKIEARESAAARGGRYASCSHRKAKEKP
jgi:uncharacterized NAD-dependent epimerase/dehydratase family protein